MVDDSDPRITSEAQVDAYLRLFALQREYLESTRQLAWRVTFGAWTLLALLIWLIVTESDFRFGCERWLVFSVPILQAISLYHGQHSMDCDKKLMVRFRKAALCELGGSHHVHDIAESSSNGARLGWIVVEIGFSAVLCLVAAVLAAN